MSPPPLSENGHSQRVILGPSIDLHTGIHETLRRHPPPGFRFATRDASHVFIVPPSLRVPFSPARHRHRAELVDFGPGAALVHSARWPVLNRRAWVADMDDFGYPVLAGRHALSPRFRARFGRPWSRSLERDVRYRAAHMLLAYAHPSCQGILFRTEAGVREATTWLRVLGIDALGETFLSKCRVVYPAQPALEPDIVERKWVSPFPLRIVFCGRDFVAKEGALALRILARVLQGAENVRVTFIGPIPPDERRTHRDVLERIDHFPELSRNEVLAVLRKSHVLLHPASRESVGMVFLEAAASGLAIIASAGRGIAHIHEIVNPAGVRLVNRDSGTIAEHEACFRRHLETTISAVAVARRMALANHYAAMHGPASLKRRNETLQAVYEQAIGRRAGTSLSLEYVRLTRAMRVSSVSGDDILRDEHGYRAEIGSDCANVYF